MSVNRFKPHIFVLPEDDANRQLANGFRLTLRSDQVHVLPEAGGWTHVRDKLALQHVDEMKIYSERFMVLLIDFDGRYPERAENVRSAIPPDLTDRVFVLGALTEPEALKQCGLGSYERIGKRMAEDCRTETHTIWTHDLLAHNETELARLRQAVGAWLFPP